MFSVIYEFKVKESRENRFREAWHQVTLQVIEHYHSLGARLHRSETGTLIAYAQWPDEDNWKDGHLIIEAEMKKLHLDSCLDKAPSILQKLTVLDDLLVSGSNAKEITT